MASVAAASLASFPGPIFSFNRDGEKMGLVHTDCAHAELRATCGEKGCVICRFCSRVERVKHSIAVTLWMMAAASHCQLQPSQQKLPLVHLFTTSPGAFR